MLTLAMISIAALAWLLALTLSPDNSLAAQFFSIFAQGATALAMARLVEQAIMLMIGQGQRGGRSDLLHTMMAIVLYMGAGLIWLHYAFGLDVSGLLATSAVATVLIGLALQATLGNLFSGLSLELERQLRVGDFIQRREIEGQVASLKWRSIVIRTTNNTRIILPNNSLTSDSFEVIRKEDPFRVIVPFMVDADVPPMDVLAVVEDVLRSGVPKIMDNPQPSALLVGAEPQSGMMRYIARYYTDDWWDRTSISSDLQVRIWYALSRHGIAMSSPLHSLLLREDTPDRASGNIATEPAKALPDTPSAVAAQLELLGQRRRYGPDEDISLQGGAAIIISGSAREEHQQSEDEEQARLQALMRQTSQRKSHVLMASQLLARIAERSALVLGPYAYELALDYARRTDDPRMLCLAMATHMKDERARREFLATAPPHTTRRLTAGAFVGFSRALSLGTFAERQITTNRRCELLYLSPEAAKKAFGAGLISSLDLIGLEPDLAGFSQEQLDTMLQKGL